MCNDKDTVGDNIYQERDMENIKIMKACIRCSIPYSECPATADCPYLIDLLNHPLTGCDPVDEDNDPSGDPISNGDPVE